MKKPGAVSSCEIEHVPGADGADHQGFDSKPQVVRRTCWGSEVEDVVDWAGVKRRTDVVFKEVKPRLALEMLDISQRAGAEIINAPDGVPLGEQCIREMRAQEAGGPAHEYAHLLFTRFRRRAQV